LLDGFLSNYMIKFVIEPKAEIINDNRITEMAGTMRTKGYHGDMIFTGLLCYKHIQIKFSLNNRVTVVMMQWRRLQMVGRMLKYDPKVW
jgi:hypothetical protein